MYHLAIEHTDLSMGNATVPKIPVEFLVKTFITSREETSLGIDDNVTDDWRERNGIPNSEGLEEMYKETLKRGRAVSTVSTAPKKLAKW